MSERRKKLAEYVVKAVRQLDERKGSTVTKIIKYVKANLITEKDPIQRLYKGTIRKILASAKRNGAVQENSNRFSVPEECGAKKKSRKSSSSDGGKKGCGGGGGKKRKRSKSGGAKKGRCGGGGGGKRKRSKSGGDKKRRSSKKGGCGGDVVRKRGRIMLGVAKKRRSSKKGGGGCKPRASKKPKCAGSASSLSSLKFVCLSCGSHVLEKDKTLRMKRLSVFSKLGLKPLQDKARKGKGL